MNANVIIYCRVSSDEQTLGAGLRRTRRTLTEVL